MEEVFGAVKDGNLNTVSKVIKKYGINNIRDARSVSR